jgi:hypothetical protein
MKSDAALLQKALLELDPVWEMAEIAEAYENSYRLYRKAGETGKAHEAAENLYRINRGALLQSGIPLPVILEFDPGGDTIGIKNTRRLTALLKKSGFTVQKTAVYTLSVYHAENGVSAEIYETASGNSIVRETFAPADFSRSGIAQLARDIAAMAFTAE